MERETYSEVIQYRETAAIKLALFRAAEAEGSDVSAFIRRAVRRELRLLAAHPEIVAVPTSQEASEAA